MTRFTKISDAGRHLPASAINHAAVLDSATDLMWSTDDIRGASEDRYVSQEATEQAVAELRLAGHTDWRLPTAHELFSLVDHSRQSPAIDTNAFPHCGSDYYLSGTQVSANPEYVWVVDFNSGSVSSIRRHGAVRVRAVRVAAPSSRQ